MSFFIKDHLKPNETKFLNKWLFSSFLKDWIEELFLI